MTTVLSGDRYRAYLLACLTLLSLAACDQQATVPASMRVADADPAQGAALVRQFGCPVCHRIPGIRTVGGTVGPPLGGLVERAYIAGGWSNRPDVVTHFVADAPSFLPQTAMPNMGITVAQARHITAFLYTLPSTP